MTIAEQYRARATEADKRAEEAHDPDLKQTFRDIARQWREMADQAERQGWT
jgi:hypothetical protein